MERESIPTRELHATRFDGGQPLSLIAHPVVWRLIAGWTLVYGLGSWLLEWSYSRVGARHPMSFIEGSKAGVYAMVWTPFLLAAVWLTDRYPVRGANDVQRLAVHVGAALCAPFAWGSVAYVICVNWVPGWAPWGVGRMYLNTANSVLYVYAAVVLICHLVRHIAGRRERDVALARAAEQATAAQLELLTMELQPHFLFNSLHAISALMQTDGCAAVSALRDVRKMLHDALRAATQSEVTLAEEQRAMEPYVRLQRLRFGDRVSFVWRVSSDLSDAAVPAALLQPLVENAVKYSLEMLSGHHRIVVNARRDGERLVLRVIDDGIGMEQACRAPVRGFGRGLANARDRLRCLYGDDQLLECRPAEEQGTVVEVRLPYRVLNVQHRRPADEPMVPVATSPVLMSEGP